MPNDGSASSSANSGTAAVNTISQSHNQSSSPSSPTANFSTQQILSSQAQYPITTTTKLSMSLRSGSRSNTPVQNTLVSGSALASNSIHLDSPPTGMTYADFVRTWTDQHISRWLAAHMCISYATTFKEHNIRGDVIFNLDQQTLKEMGITSIGDRIRIINAVMALRQKCAARNTVTSSITISSPLYSPRVTLNSFDHYSSIVPPADEEQYGDSRPEEAGSSVARHRGRPAPLYLRQSQINDLRRIIREQSGAPESARSATTSANRNVNQVITAGLTTNSRQPTRLHALATQHSGRQTPTQTDAPSPPITSTSGSYSSNGTYAVGRGAFGHSTTPSYSAAPSLEYFPRKLVKFSLADEGHSITISVADCPNGEAVLEKVLKKFGKVGTPRLRAESDPSLGGSDPELNALCVDGWCVYLDWGMDGGSGKPLTEAELLSVCHAGPVHQVYISRLHVQKPDAEQISMPQQVNITK